MYPLFAAVGVAVGICGFQLVRNICINPEVRSLFIFNIFMIFVIYELVCLFIGIFFFNSLCFIFDLYLIRV